MKKLITFFTVTLLASTTSNAQWTAVTPPELNQFANCLLSKDGKLYVGMNSGIFVSNNNGDTWDSTGSTAINTGMATKFMASTNNSIYAAGVSGGWGNYVNPIKYDGQQWVADTIGLPQVESRTLFADENRILIAGVGNTSISLYTKLDSESSWTPVTSIPVPNSIFAIYKLNNTYYVITGGYRKIWSSTDGITFTETNYSIPSDPTCAYSANNAVYVGTGAGLYKSTDGLTFTRIDVGFPMYMNVLGPGVKAIHVNDNQVYASSMWVAGVYESNTTNNDTTWTSISNGELLIEAEVTSVITHNNALFATQAVWSAGKAPILRYGTATTGISEVKAGTCINAYPNPANSVINIEAKENMNIKIFNVLGTAVATQKLNTGNNVVEISSLINGVYFIHSEKGGIVKFIKE